TVEELVPEILQRRNAPQLGGPFKDEKEFISFLGGFIDTREFNDDEDKIPLFFGAELNFRISCIGVSGKMTKEMVAIVYDANGVQARLKEALTLDQKNNNPNGQPHDNDCTDLTGVDLYKCQCEGSGDAAAEKKCIEDKKTAATNNQNQDQSNNQQNQIQPGPPKMLFLQVK
ncbi:MAG: hypothetical protein HRT44_13590, partial [Bdellovibrionales bacterium]|nr:hypothetical protein [Bdellovibrionales bacterium]NQZ20271.1 hypothetical protein [Bdellovibrionales bacterium]